uniref:U3 small nucleolar RNA-associated protein 6 homolog n=3 Tax=Arion vulgaris TaxID=1028688 RepID=A0A0B7A1C5_9EUPU
MAEYVHQTLEEMIPELEEMNRIGLFSVKETKIILKNREKYEYTLRQLTKTKSMFLNYIEYEKKVLELLKIRRKKLGHDAKKRDVEKSIADRIHKLYHLMTIRFSEDVTLWEQHIQFSKDLNEKAYATRLYTQVLKIHSHNEEMWVKAAQWESSTEGNSNSELAREILLKGQRVNPESQFIILEMFHMELKLAKQILKRKAVLGIASNQAQENVSSGEGDKIVELKVAEIVYRQGVEIFSDDPEFHLKMFNICCWFKEAITLQHLIISDLKQLYPDTPLVWNGLALSCLHKLRKMQPGQRKDAVARCLDMYSVAVETVQTKEMWSMCLQSHLAILHLREIKDSEWILKTTLTMFEKAIQLGTLSEDLFVHLVKLLTDLSMTEDVERVVSLGIKQYPSSSQLWLAKLRVIASLEGENHEDNLETTLNAALRQVQSEESWSLWQFVLSHMGAEKSQGLEKLMERSCRSITPEVCLPAKEWCLHWTFRQGGLKAARNVYNSLRKMRPISLNFYRLYVKIESSQIEPNLKLIRSAFEEALVEFGQNEPDLWLNYIEMEKVVANDGSRSGVIHQRALNGLDPHLKESLIRKQVMIGLGG